VRPAATTSTRAGFAAVDDDPDRGALVAALDEQAELPAIRRLRSTAVELIAPEPRRKLLDAGCGVGDMTRKLAAHVVPGGKAIGVDTSATMLAEARRRTTDPALPADFRHADVTALEHTTASFDGAYSERVFQHLESPGDALAELVRVTRSGGWIVVVDTDWGMHAVHGADPSLTKRVLANWAEHTPNGWSGRRLPALFANAGLAHSVVITDTITGYDARRSAMEPFGTMASVAEHHGVLTTNDARTWLAQLADASASGSFFWAITMFLVAATRP
jgi:SAM-dependent methyltransferase